MNAIFVNTPNGIIKATVIYNPVIEKHQVIIGSDVCKDFPPRQEKEAVAYMQKSFPREKIIKPHITLLISLDNPLSSQCVKITGDSYNLSDFEDLYNTQLIKHRSTGLIFRVISKNEIRGQFKAARQ